MSARMSSDPEMEGLLSGFRGSVRRWSALQPGAEPPVSWKPAPRRRQGAGALRWALAAAAALVVVAAVLLWRNARQRRVEADALLWQEIDAHVSRQVPAPLEPLMKLVAWEPVSSKGEAQ